MHTREHILCVAREMFNTRGFDSCSMREVARQCGIAVGNLTYYFPKKQDLREALLNETFAVARPETPIETLGDMNCQFGHMLDALENNAFHFLDQNTPAGGSHNQAIRERILEGFARLQAKGEFSASFTSEKQHQVLDVILMSHLTWAGLRLRQGVGPTREAFLREHWAVLEPFLTQKGRQSLERMLEAAGE